MAAIASALAESRQMKRKVGFKREHGMFEVYEDLMAKMEVSKHFYNVTVHGKELLLMKSSLGLFRPDVAGFSKIRYWTIWLTEWRKFDYVVLAVIIMNCILMAHPVAYDSAYREEHPALRDVAWSINVFSTIFFATECVLKIIARGLIFSAAPDVPYLRDVLSWLDLTVVVTGMMEILSVGQDETDSFVVFRSLRVARALRTMHILPHLRMIVVALVDSGTRLLSWTAFVGFIFTVFAIVGNSLFGVVYWQRCRLTEAPIRDANGNSYWPIDPAQTRFCGGRYECQPAANGNKTYCGSPVDSFKGVVVDYDPWPEINDNPLADYGYTGFQTFQAGMLTIFQVSTMEGWSKLMYRFQDGKGNFFAVCFFGIVVLFGGLLLMNLVLAILWERFDIVVREEVTKEKSDKQIIPDRILKKRLHELVTEVSSEAERRAQSKVFRQLDTDTKLGMKNITYSVATNTKWVAFMDFIVVLNAVVLACDTHPPMDETVADILEKLNALCTIAFMIEVSLKMLGYGMTFFSDQFNVFDLVLVLVSFVELMGLEGETSVSALRTARLLRLFKMMKMQMSIRVLMGVLQRATIPTYNFSVIALLCLFCFAMLFTQMLYETDAGESSMLSFHDIGWAYVSVFSLLGTDGWSKNMIAFCKAGNFPLATLLLFVSGLIVGHIVLMNLFLGIFAAAFAQSRDELLDEYRILKLTFETPDPEEHVTIIQDNFDKEEVEHFEEEQPSSPRWPNDVSISVCNSKNMNLFKMMSIKKAAAQRKADKGEALMWKRDHEILSIFKKSATELLEKAGVSTTTLQVPPIKAGDTTDTIVTGESKVIVPVVSHNATPPVALDCKDTAFEAEARTPVRQTPSTDSTLCSKANADLEAPTPAPILCTPVASHFAMPPSDANDSHMPYSERDDGLSPKLHRSTWASQVHRTLLDRPGSSCLSGSTLRHRVTPCQARRPQTEYPSFKELYQRAKESAEPFDFSGGELSRFGTGKSCSVQNLSNDISTSSLWRSRQRDIASRVRIATRFEQVAEHPLERSETHRSDPRHQIDHTVSGLQGDSQDFAVPVAEAESAVPAARLCEPVGIHSAVPSTSAAAVSLEQIARNNHLSKIEKISRRVVKWRYFETTNFILIFVSSMSLAAENPSRDPRKSIVTILNMMEVVVTLLFTAEMFVKLVAFGVWVPLDDPLPDTVPYFRVGWNWIDAIAVGSGILGLLLGEIAKDNPIKMVRVVRLIRVMRPLRLLKRNKGMCLIVESLLAALPTLLNMIVIAGLFYLGFGILFVNMLKGALGYCSLDPKGKLRHDIVTKEDCLIAGGEWLNSESNFDHIGRSLITLLHVGTGENWIEVMMAAGSSQGIDMQPRPNSRAHLALLVVLFVAVTNFFLLNLFIGVLVDQYMVTKAELAGADVLTAEDRRWLQLQQEIFLRQPDIIIKGRVEQKTDLDLHHKAEVFHCDKPYTLHNRIRRLSFWIVRRSFFDPFIILNIIGNTVVLVIGRPTDSQHQRDTLANLSFGFVIVFAVEALLKILAYRFHVYWQDHWNRYDFIVVLGSVVSAFADLIPGLKTSDFALFMSSFRVARLFRLARFVTFLQIMAQVLWTLLLGLFNVSGLLGLVIFIYACLGVGLFGTVMDGERLGPDANFHTFGSALLLLLRVATGEQWQLLMYDVVSYKPGCVEEVQTHEELSRDGPRGCGAWLGYPYFVSYVLVVGVVLINLIVAVVLDGFTCVQDMDAIEVFKKQFQILRRKWHQLDPEGTGYLEFEDCIKMLMEIDQPIGLFGHTYEIAMLHMRTLPLYMPKKVHAREVIILVAKRAKLWLSGISETELGRASLDSELENGWMLKCGTTAPPETKETLYVAHLFIARRLGKYYFKKQEALKAKILQEMQQEGRKSTIDDMNSKEFSDMLRKERVARISAQRLQEQRLKDQEKRRQDRMTVLQSLDEQIHKVEEELPHLQQKLSPLPWPPRELF